MPRAGHSSATRPPHLTLASPTAGSSTTAPSDREQQSERPARSRILEAARPPRGRSTNPRRRAPAGSGPPRAGGRGPGGPYLGAPLPSGPACKPAGPWGCAVPGLPAHPAGMRRGSALPPRPPRAQPSKPPRVRPPGTPPRPPRARACACARFKPSGPARAAWPRPCPFRDACRWVLKPAGSPGDRRGPLQRGEARSPGRL